MGRSRGHESQDSVSSILGSEIVHVAVGPEQREFSIHRKILESSSDYFANIIASALPPEPRPSFFSTRTSTRTQEWDSDAYTIWLAAESPAMFELFVLWMYQRSAGLTKLVDDATAAGALGSRPGGAKVIANTCRALSLHWNMARLHVFAAKVGIDELQDLALDCLQDIFFRCDWAASPKFVKFVYERCDPDYAFRLRKWAVATVAWTLATQDVDLMSLCPGLVDEDGVPVSLPNSATSPSQSVPLIARRFGALLVDIPDLLGDFSDHVSKISQLRGSASLKNPSIRLPSNTLKSDERQYGFRMCSFHSHRRDVGQGTCPHRLSIASRTPASATRGFYTGPTSASFKESTSDTSNSSPPDGKNMFPCLGNAGQLVHFRPGSGV